MKKIIHFLHIHAPTDKVYSALTSAQGLSGWWSTDVKVEPGVGGLVDFRFAGDFNPDMKVTALETNDRVQWTCIAGHENWKDNQFSFEIVASQGGTDLRFVQVYAQELGDDVYGTYNFNWGYYLNSLKQLCETGKGAPFKAESATKA